ncbi:hypothetical protein BDA96_04G236500 [Sorghum bicolor]|uniref:Uncharacterized protein n=2 Tax=Sorghum bicolor TaxID=4558 RepID=A0A194YR19_SORBI|nr:hypothetical protein BDA96_04G236500 [Sorghum bicolor]KXG30677.1 hypothetical protein SORBI_3004G222200 [Sorghum bicolor]KXG30678.1 hypothetical protein SORBI_3004G222200 [Sorghum bicolor]
MLLAPGAAVAAVGSRSEEKASSPCMCPPKFLSDRRICLHAAPPLPSARISKAAIPLSPRVAIASHPHAAPPLSSARKAEASAPPIHGLLSHRSARRPPFLPSTHKVSHRHRHRSRLSTEKRPREATGRGGGLWHRWCGRWSPKPVEVLPHYSQPGPGPT